MFSLNASAKYCAPTCFIRLSFLDPPVISSEISVYVLRNQMIIQHIQLANRITVLVFKASAKYPASTSPISFSASPNVVSV